MKMDLVLRQEVSLETRVELRGRSPLEELFEIWARSPHYAITLGDSTVEFVLCAPRYLKAVDEQEHYGVYFGDMSFVSTLTPPRWIPFVVLHEWAHRKLAGEGWGDTTDEAMARHFRTIGGELTFATQTLSADEFVQYLAWRRSVERTRFFDHAREWERIREDRLARNEAGGPPALPLPVSKWTARSLKISTGMGLIGYGMARDLGASHCDLLMEELSGMDVAFDDVFAVLSPLAYVGRLVSVAVPKGLAPVVWILSGQVTRPVIVQDHEDDAWLYVRHMNGQTEQSVQAIIRRFWQAQEKEARNQEQKERRQMEKMAQLPTHSSSAAAPVSVLPTPEADPRLVLLQALLRRLPEGVPPEEVNALVDEQMLATFAAEVNAENVERARLGQLQAQIEECQLLIEKLQEKQRQARAEIDERRSKLDTSSEAEALGKLAGAIKDVIDSRQALRALTRKR
ncbi:hypothetical protein HYV73_03055 [Candidatus Uhrbacteria bacterium]|nr:hypothetical protein [Candidatus Uhrbacteria bacterium]